MDEEPGGRAGIQPRRYLADPEVRRAAWRSRVDCRHLPRPSPTAVTGRSSTWNGRAGCAIVTQNIDELHQRAGSDPGLVIEVHGTAHWTICWSCGDARPMADALERVRAGEEDPPCARCGGILKSDTISFGQQLVPEVIDAAFDAAERCDLLLAIGSTLSVYPAAGVVPAAKRAGALVVILNAEPTAMDDHADAVVRGPIGAVLPELIARQTDQ